MKAESISKELKWYHPRKALQVLTEQKRYLFEWFGTVYRAHLPTHIAKRFSQNRLSEVAAALAYQTLLSLVPLIVVGFSILNVFSRQEGSGSELLTYLLQNFFPLETTKIVDFLKDLPSLSEPQTVGLVGVITLLMLSTTLLYSIEKTLNHIWKVTRQRSIFTRFTTYFSLLTLAPVALSITIYQASLITENSGILVRVLPYFLNLSAFWVCYNLPKFKTRWHSTLVGALLAVTLFEISKEGFSLYVRFAAQNTYTNIYGAIGILPIFLLWVYVGWIIFLLGAQVAYSVQNIELLAELDRQQDTTLLSEDLFEQATDEAAMRLFYEIMRAHYEGKSPPDVEELALLIPLPVWTTQFLLERFLQKNLILSVTQGGFVPARSPQNVLVEELLEGLRKSGEAHPSDSMPEPLASLLEKLHLSRKETLHEMTFEDILRNDDTVEKIEGND